MLLRSASLLTGILLLSVVCALAQSNNATPNFVDFRVVISFQDGTHFGDDSNKTGMAGADSATRGNESGSHPTGLGSNLQIRVQLFDESGATITEKSPTSEGMVTFNVVGFYSTARGKLFPSYRLRVFGSEIEETWVESLQPGQADRVVNVQIRKKGEKQLSQSGKGTVSASGLKIPGKAQKELDKGNEALADSKLDNAKQHFQKAAEIYPQFEMAYNNLGVVLMKQGDTAGGKEAFEKALSINDKFARAYVNLAKISVLDKQYDEAMTLFMKSLSIEPLNPDALSGVCQAGIMAKQYQQVISAATKLHSVPHDNMPLCHFAAGLAYRNLNKPQEAIDEYILYLKEASTSDSLVAKAREAIAELNKQTAVR